MRPSMICGPSGVGKSLFLHIFKQLYREKTGSKSSPATVNCSHFSGDIARSELFGHVRGAFTGAVKERAGWIEKAHGGVLILEEVGDLPPETQAKLLCFVETGEYHKMGCSKIRHSDVQIIAATNRYEKLRKDFQHRFFPFHVPPLHQRRGDVCYHLAMTIPELIGQLAPWEVLALMAHEWPGNVREVERTALLLKRRKLLETEDPGIELWEEVVKAMGDSKILPARVPSNQPMEDPPHRSGMTHFRNVVLGGNRTHKLCLQLQQDGINVAELHDLLRKFHLGIMLKREEIAFDAFEEDVLEKSLQKDSRLNVLFPKSIPAFESAHKGLCLFCQLLFQDPKAPRNLLEPIKRPEVDFTKSEPHVGAHLPEISQLAQSMGLPSPQSPYDVGQGPEWITTMSRKELMKTYYRALLNKTTGNKFQSSQARRAEIHHLSRSPAKIWDQLMNRTVLIENIIPTCEPSAYLLNQAAAFLKANGYTVVQSGGNGSEIVVVNTCCVTRDKQRACERRIDNIIQHMHPGKLVLFGCLAETTRKYREGDGMHLVGPKNLGKLHDIFSHRIPIDRVFSPRIDHAYFTPCQTHLTHKDYFVMICQGCENRCTYCNIKNAKGSVRSRGKGENSFGSSKGFAPGCLGNYASGGRLRQLRAGHRLRYGGTGG